MNQNQHQVVYQADHNEVQTLQSIRSKVHGVGQMHQNRHVRVQTVDGQMHEGVIVHVDGCMMYLGVHQPVDQRAFLYPQYPYYPGYNTVLPLVLYDLLVISLLA